MTAQPRLRAVALAAAASLIGAACTGGVPASVTPTAPAPTTTNSPSATATPTVSTPPFGGDVTFGAEGWPDCLNPITACANDPWAFYTVFEHVLPRAMQLGPEGNFVASPLLVEAPSLPNGGLTQSPFTVTFKIRPEAVWDDGSAITSSDFDFTWRAIIGTIGAIRQSGYDLIESVDVTDPHTAVIRFASVYADWADLFGGAFGFLLKRSAFPDQTGIELPDLRSRLQDSIPFSGGPFVLRSWSSEEATLVRNDRYFGAKANFDKVGFKPIMSQDLELLTLMAGDVAAIYINAPRSGFFPPSVNPAVHWAGTRGFEFEAMWFNLARPPMDDTAVREALMYAIDRQLIIDKIIQFSDPDSTVLNCGFVALPAAGPWCQAEPFARYTYDPATAKAILEADGYDCSKTPCTKDGRPLEVDYTTIATSPLRTDTMDLLIPKALDAGFRLKVVNFDGGTLGNGRGGLLGAGDYPVQSSADPSVTNLFACNEIPTERNGFTGQNYSHWCNPAADQLMRESDEELDPTRRLQLLNEVYALEAADHIGLPLYAVPKVSVWRTDQIDGPITEYSSSPYGMFFNMNEWYVVTP